MWNYFHIILEPEWEIGNSPVTEADRAAESTIRGLICAAFPQDGVFAKNFGDMQSRSPLLQYYRRI